MSHSLVYIIPFKSLRNDAFEIKILKENHLGGSPIELIGGADPLIVSMEDEDFLYTPIRKSSAKITIVGSDYLQALYSSNYHEWKVNIYRDQVLIWTGFINPETYTQDYVNSTIELTIEASSALSVLENIKYESDVKGWITIWDYFKKMVTASKGDYKGVIIPSTYQRDENNIFENLQLNEANFFDEDNEAMMLLETLEELCKFLNWTITDYDGYLTFIDIDFVGEYRIYNRALTEFTTTQPSIYSVQDLGFNGGNNTLDIIPGYTKASIKVSNYNVDELIHDIDYDELDILSTLWSVNRDGKTTMWQFLKPEGLLNYKVYHYDNDLNAMSEEDFQKEANYGVKNILGSSFVNCFSFKTSNPLGSTTRPTPAEYSESSIKYKGAVRVRAKVGEYHGSDTYYRLRTQPILTISSPERLLYTNGAICINLEAEPLAMHYTSDDFNELVATYYNAELSAFECSLRIGAKYWDGNKWASNECRFKLPLDDSATTGFRKVKSNKRLFEGPNKADGYLVDLYSPQSPKITGDLEFTIYTSREYFKPNFVSTTEGYHISNISIRFEPSNARDLRESKSDRIYENVINQHLVTQLDEIEFKINSHNNDGISRSKILQDGSYITNNLYSRIAQGEIRPEEQLITRIVNQYSRAKVKLTQELEFRDIRVIDILTDSYLTEKQFVTTGIEYSAAESRMTLNLIEKNV